MEIKINNRNSSCIVKFSDGNATIEVDVKSCVYRRLPDGKIDPSRRAIYDIDNDIIQEMASALEQLLNYRERPIDTGCLVAVLMNKTPREERVKILAELVRDYSEE